MAAIGTLFEEQVLRVRPVGEATWVIDVPDVLQLEHIDLPDTLAVDVSPRGTAYAIRTLAHSTCGSSRVDPEAYPAAAIHGAEVLVRAS